METKFYHHFIYTFLTVVIITNGVSGELCTYPTDPCICQTSSFRLNLTGLMNSKNWADLSIAGDSGWTYYIQPCNKPMTYYFYDCYSKNPNLVSCQVSSNMMNGYGLGETGKYDAVQADGGYILTNSFVDPYDYNERKLHLTLLCSDTEVFIYHGQSGTQPLFTYTFTLLSKFACFENPSSGGGISPGSVMLIVFFALIIVYLVGGVLFLKFGKKAEGKEVIPNYSLWSTFPSLIKSGFLYTFSICKKSKQYDNI